MGFAFLGLKLFFIARVYSYVRSPRKMFMSSILGLLLSIRVFIGGIKVLEAHPLVGLSLFGLATFSSFFAARMLLHKGEEVIVQGASRAALFVIGVFFAAIFFYRDNPSVYSGLDLTAVELFGRVGQKESSASTSSVDLAQGNVPLNFRQFQALSKIASESKTWDRPENLRPETRSWSDWEEKRRTLRAEIPFSLSSIMAIAEELELSRRQNSVYGDYQNVHELLPHIYRIHAMNSASGAGVLSTHWVEKWHCLVSSRQTIAADTADYGMRCYFPVRVRHPQSGSNILDAVNKRRDSIISSQEALRRIAFGLRRGCEWVAPVGVMDSGWWTHHLGASGYADFPRRLRQHPRSAGQ